MQAVALVFLSSSAIAVSFPTEFRGSWSGDLAGCEPEFTQGYKIRADTIHYYEGTDKIYGVSHVTNIKSPAGHGRTMIAKLRYKFHDEASTSTERFTVVGQWLYRSDAKLPLGKHLLPANRKIRCPSGSTG